MATAPMFVMIHVSFVLGIILLVVVNKYSHFSQVRMGFYFLLFVMAIWNLGTLLEMDFRIATGDTNMAFINMCYIGICMTPVALIYFAHSVTRPGKKPSLWHILLLVVPATSIIMVLTNERHHLFFRVFSLNSREAVYGPYYYFHAICAYGCIAVALCLLFSHSIRAEGLFSRQTLLLIAGMLFPLCGNIMYSFGILVLDFGIIASLFTIAILFFFISFYRYRFLGTVPISVRQIVDMISDGYFVTDSQTYLISHNKAFVQMLPGDFCITKQTTFRDIVEAFESSDRYDQAFDLWLEAAREKHVVVSERNFRDGRFARAEITPVFQNDVHIGTIVLLSDITAQKRAFETIRETQAMMLDRERLVSLGQIAGGIAHNLRTPIMSISGGLVALRDYVQEYRESAMDPEVTKDDHAEIADDMDGWIEKIESHVSYLSELVATVKEQAVSLNSNETEWFTVGDLLKRIELLMKQELQKHHVKLIIDTDEIDTAAKINGDIASLVQVFDNLIINAVHAYDGREGEIRLCIMRKNDSYAFTVSDYAGGMPDEIKGRVFKEMVTTKGKNGTGLGLYVTYSTIKGKFNGMVHVDSIAGHGTTFTILIPIPPAGFGGMQE